MLLARHTALGRSFVGRRAVVVGGTSGIGKGIALRLAELGYSVTVVGRDADRGAEVVAQMGARSAQQQPQQPHLQHAFRACNAFLVHEVEACAAALSAEAGPALDLLVLTQGMATLQGRTETPEGLDQKLALHYFGRVAFTLSALPALRRAPSPTVISVLSAGVHAPYPGWAQDLELRQAYSLKGAADAAGLYNDLAAEALALEEQDNRALLFVHAAPGFVNTAWGTEMPWPVRALIRAIQPLGRSPADCAEAMLEPIFAREEGGRGGGWALIGPEGQPAKPTPLQGLARASVWQATKQLLQRARAGERLA